MNDKFPSLGDKSKSVHRKEINVIVNLESDDVQFINVICSNRWSRIDVCRMWKVYLVDEKFSSTEETWLFILGFSHDSYLYKMHVGYVSGMSSAYKLYSLDIAWEFYFNDLFLCI